MAKKWVVAAKKADFDRIGNKFHISPYLSRIIRNRDIVEDDEIDRFLNGTIDDMHDPALLMDIDKAAEVIQDAIDAEVKIRIVGDYDIDGVCASYILKSGLEYMGACVDVRLPDRVLDGYGINENMIQDASDDGVELIITCDNGIAAAKQVELAMALGISVVITDHHEVPYEENDGVRQYILPPADAVVDPKREDCQYPFKGICGAMVAYKLIEYMLRGYEGSDEKELCRELFSFAAFATIGDVMELRDENRIAVKYGIEILKNTNNIGMKALMLATGIEPQTLTAFHIGFVLGPCVNATGRLESAKRALELFSCVDPDEAALISKELKDLNEARKSMTVSFAKEAIAIAKQEYADDKVLVIFLPACHESIAGIVAGRIREQYYKPTIVLTLDNEGEVKGSGRSIEGYDMYEELTKVSSLFTKFGGHKMAAGLSMKKDNVDKLRRLLNENTTLTDEDIIEKMVIDIPLPIGYVSEGFVRELDKLSPFGVGNPRPLFAQKDVHVERCALIGKNHNVVKLQLSGKGDLGQSVSQEAVIFENAQAAYDEIKNRDTISILYQPGINEYMGSKSIQLTIKDWF